MLPTSLHFPHVEVSQLCTGAHKTFLQGQVMSHEPKLGGEAVSAHVVLHAASISGSRSCGPCRAASDEFESLTCWPPDRARKDSRLNSFLTPLTPLLSTSRCWYKDGANRNKKASYDATSPELPRQKIVCLGHLCLQRAGRGFGLQKALPRLYVLKLTRSRKNISRLSFHTPCPAEHSELGVHCHHLAEVWVLTMRGKCLA